MKTRLFAATTALILLVTLAPAALAVDYSEIYEDALTMASNDLTNVGNLENAISMLESIGSYQFAKLYTQYFRALDDLLHPDPNYSEVRLRVVSLGKAAKFVEDMAMRGLPSCEELATYIDARALEASGDIDGAVALYETMVILDAMDRAIDLNLIAVRSAPTSTPEPTPTPVPGPAMTLTVTPQEGYLDLNWTGVAGATKYEVYRDGDLVRTTLNTGYQDRDISGGSSYRYLIRAYLSNGEIVSSNTMTRSVKAAPTPKPTDTPKPTYNLCYLDMTLDEFQEKLLDLVQQSRGWTESSAPQTLSEFPFMPEGLFRLLDAAAADSCRLEKKGDQYFLYSSIDSVISAFNPMTQQ